MGDYLGVLLNQLDPAEHYDTAMLECGGDFKHSAAIFNAIINITAGNYVVLTRRRLMPGYDETTGTVRGYVVGGSHHHTGKIILAVQRDDDEVVGVDVTDLTNWHWRVGVDGDNGDRNSAGD